MLARPHQGIVINKEDAPVFTYVPSSQGQPPLASKDVRWLATLQHKGSASELILLVRYAVAKPRRCAREIKGVGWHRRMEWQPGPLYV